MRKVEDRAGNQSDARRNPMDQDISELEHSRDLHNIPAVWYKAVIQSAMEGFLLANDEGKILDVNDAFCRMSGYSRGELLSIRIQDIDVEFIEAPEEFGQKVLEVKEAGGASAVKQHRCKDGRIIDVAVNAKYLDMGQGLLFCFHRDITQQKKVCQQLKESEERYRALVDLGGAVGEAVVMLQDKEQAEAVHTYVSDEWSRITGYTREELLGKSFFDFVHPEYRQASRERHSRKMAGENTPGLFEVLILRKDGAEVPLELTSAYTTYNGTRANVAYIRDITKRKRMEQALKESEERYRAIFENTGTATAIIEEDTMLSLVNTEFERLSGYSKEEVEGKKSWTEFVVKEDLDRLREYHRLREIDPDAAPRQYVARFNDRQGKVKDILVTVDMIPRTKKRVISLLDVTESKRSAEALKASEEKLRLMFESVAEGITVADLEGNILQVNDATARLHGYKRKDELIGKSAFELIAEKDKPRAIVNLKRTLKEGYSGTIEYTLMRKDGDEFAAELNAATLRDASGKPIGFIAITRNITERKKMEESLRMERDKAQRYLDIAGVMIIAVDVDQKISLINQRGCQILGYRDEEIVGQNWLDSFVPERYRGEVKAVFKRLMAGEAEAVEYFENPVVTKRGEERIIAWHNSVVTDRAGNIVGALGSGEDITELKRVETELRSSHEQLRHFSAHLRRAREEERKQIALRIHDELGQTLTALKIDLSWLARRIPKEQELLVDKANSIIKMVDMTIQTVKGVSAELRPGILDDLGLTAAIEWQAQEFQKATGISCRVIPNHKEISLNQDAAIAFFRILQELLTNVFRHAQATSVNVSLKEKDGTAVLQVKDNGKGITRQQIAAPNSFGLLGVQERAHFLGGEVKIIGAPDKGTTITVSIPLHKEEKSGA